MTEKTYPSEEQGITKAPEDEDTAIDTGEEDEDPDRKKGREHLRDEDAISDEEEGFLEGAAGLGTQGLCASCKQPLSDDPHKVIEREIEGEIKLFCSVRCANKAEE